MNLKILNLELSEPRFNVHPLKPNFEPQKLPKKTEPQTKPKVLKSFKCIEYQKMGKFSIWYWNEPENSEPRFIHQNRTSQKRPNLELQTRFFSSLE